MWRRTFILFAALTCAAGARDARFHPGQTLGQTETAADFVFKGTVLSSTSAGALPTKRYDDRFFGSDDIFSEMLTRFKIVSVVKGDTGVSEITFRHFEDVTPPGRRRGIPQIAYDFEPGRSYLVFARNSGTTGVCGQLGIGVTFPGYKSDYGMMRCIDNRPITVTTIQEIVWDELVAMLHGKNPGDVEYAVAQLDQMSGGNAFPADYRYGIDFQSQDVLKLINPYLKSPDPHVAQAASALTDRLTARVRNPDPHPQ